MRIQIVSNLYPPYFIGGYELGCHSVASELATRGHVVNVLTSRYQTRTRKDITENISRLLYERISSETLIDKALIPWREMQNRHVFSTQLKAFKPDLVYIWNLTGTSSSVIPIARRTGLPVVIYASDPWLEKIAQNDYFLRLLYGAGRDLPRTVARLSLKPIFDILGISFDAKSELSDVSIQCTSDYIRKSLQASGVHPKCCKVVPWGVKDYFLQANPKTQKGGTSILYTGQLAEHKGVHTLIKAYRHARVSLPRPSLRIAGSAHLKEYERHLKTLAGDETDIIFLGRLELAQLRKEYEAADIYVFPSEWNEPFAIAPLEAMAVGIPVIATQTGGSRELFKNEVNALTFPEGNYFSLSRQLVRLANDTKLRDQLRRSARETILRKYTLPRMVDAIEADLEEARYSCNNISRQNRPA